MRLLGVTPIVPKPLTSGAKADGRFGKQDFVYDAGEDVYRSPAGERLTWRYWNVEAGRKLHNYSISLTGFDVKLPLRIAAADVALQLAESCRSRRQRR